MGLFQRLTSKLLAADSVSCYHCDERVAKRHVIVAVFAGLERELCCHGCETVLLLVAANGLTETYVNSKLTNPLNQQLPIATA